MPERLPLRVSQAFMPHPPEVMGVAVSGGSDSMALLHLLHEFCQHHKITLRAVTVNHNLRAEAADEAAHVAAQCARIGVPHETLVWSGWTGEGNLQSAAREARYSKMAEWARARGISTIAVGHTADDQAETVLMRLARRSGVDGLSGMPRRMVREGVTWVRPLLSTRRETLKSYLQEQSIGWVDDPSNEDVRFDRVKARRALGLLAELGLGAEALSEVADHLAEARRALEWQTFMAARQLMKLSAGALVMDEARWRLHQTEIQRRLLVSAIAWVGGSDYGPRRGAVAHVMESLMTGQAATADGCHIRRIGGRIWIFRELNHLRAVEALPLQPWDNTWCLIPRKKGAADPELRVRALGLDGLQHCDGWRETGLPHVVLQSTPGVWKGDALIAAPLAGMADGWLAQPLRDIDTFYAALLTH